MIPNVITLSRLLLTFTVIALFGMYHTVDYVLIITIGLIFILDAIDGVVARKYNQMSAFGAVFDTVADRLIENGFWIYFAMNGYVPLWMSITVMARGFAVDSLQHYVGLPKNEWTYLLVRSRTSRALYGASKMITFLYFASVSAFKIQNAEVVGVILATSTITMCLIRGLPVFVETWRLLPRNQK